VRCGNCIHQRERENILVELAKESNIYYLILCEKGELAGQASN
jgi:hypothetical protein